MLAILPRERNIFMEDGDLKVKEVAERLGLDIFTVSRYCRRGLFPGAYKKNPFSLRRSEWFIPEEAVIAFEQKRRDQASNNNTK
jgi:predicted site-specific integrase-resolvase